jgi:hypothetical protein
MISDHNISFYDGIEFNIVNGRKVFSCYGQIYWNGKTYSSIVEFLQENRKRVYFLREKIICLKKLLEIPELYQEVYYAHKGDFISLLRKI